MTNSDNCSHFFRLFHLKQSIVHLAAFINPRDLVDDAFSAAARNYVSRDFFGCRLHCGHSSFSLLCTQVKQNQLKTMVNSKELWEDPTSPRVYSWATLPGLMEDLLKQRRLNTDIRFGFRCRHVKKAKIRCEKTTELQIESDKLTSNDT
jgi:hypothetical protein